MSSYFTSYFSTPTASTLTSTSGYTASPSATPASSSWSTTLSSRLTNLRKVLSTTSEQDDPDNEDASHVSNVLRAYYTEKGRPLPPWLPPDPKKPPPVSQHNSYSYGQQQQGQQGGNVNANVYGGYGQNVNSYGAQVAANRNSSGGGGARGAGLSDLWDSGSSQAQAPQQPASLRAQRERPTPNSLHSQASSVNSYSTPRGGLTPSGGGSLGPRPLPSQREGSYQNAGVQGGGSGAGLPGLTPSTSSGGLGSRDRLKSRLGSGGAVAGGQGRSSPAPPASSGGAPTSGLTYGQSAYGGSSNGQPYMAASQPWSTGSDDQGFNGGYGAGNESRYGDSGISRRQGVLNRPRPGGPR